MRDPFIEKVRREQRHNLITLGVVIVVMSVLLLITVRDVAADEPETYRSRSILELGSGLLKNRDRGERPGTALGRAAWRIQEPEQRIHLDREEPVIINRFGDTTIISQGNGQPLICYDYGHTVICN